MDKCIVFAGGGTGGHVFPGLAVIEELKKQWQGRIVWIGSRKGMEKQIVTDAGIPFHGIPAGKMRRYFSFRNFVDIFNIIAGIICSVFLLAREKACVIFSKGGFVSVPVVVAGAFLRIPVITHESDFDPGIATRINARFAKKICITFRETAAFFKGLPADKIVVTGNPVRAAVFQGNPAQGRSIVGCSRELKMILVVGGSQGALSLNKAIGKILEQVTERCFVVHQVGEKNFTSDIKASGHYFPAPFFRDEFPHILSAADLVISRAGANSLWEFAALHVPSILIPLPLSGSRGDQIRNARIFEQLGLSAVLDDDESLAEKLLETILNLIDNDTVLKEMRSCAEKLNTPDSCRIISSLIVSETERIK